MSELGPSPRTHALRLAPALLLAGLVAGPAGSQTPDPARTPPPLQKAEFDARSYFPMEIGNTWIWSGDGPDFSVKTVKSLLGTPDGIEIVLESTDIAGVPHFTSEYLRGSDGRLYRKSVRGLQGLGVETVPPALYAPFSAKPGESIVKEVSEVIAGEKKRTYFHRVTIKENRPFGTALGRFADCLLVVFDELETEDAPASAAPAARLMVWFARDLGPIKVRQIDHAGRVSEQQVVFARIGPQRYGADPRENP